MTETLADEFERRTLRYAEAIEDGYDNVTTKARNILADLAFDNRASIIAALRRKEPMVAAPAKRFAVAIAVSEADALEEPTGPTAAAIEGFARRIAKARIAAGGAKRTRKAKAGASETGETK